MPPSDLPADNARAASGPGQSRPQNAQDWLRLAHGLAQARDPDGARAAFIRAIALTPEDPRRLGPLANALRQLQAPADLQITVFERLVRAAPNADNHLLTAYALDADRRYAESKPHLRAALRLDPYRLAARWLEFQRPNRVMATDQADRDDFLARWEQGIAEFERIDFAEPQAAAQADAVLGCATNFYLSYLGRPLLRQHVRHAEVVRRMVRAASPDVVETPPRPIGHGRRRIAVVSASAHQSSITRVWSGALLALDPADFELGVFYPGTREDAMIRRWRERAARFESGARRAGEWVAALQQFAPDVLIHLDAGRDPIMQALAALRLAPVQAATWADPVTTGMPAIDYFLSADAMEPDNAAEHYSETLVRLPRLGSLLAPPPPVEVHRSDAAGAIGFLCVQAAAKLHPGHDRLFARILERNPRARLDILSGMQAHVAEDLAARLRRTFARSGLDFDARCRVHAALPVPDYLARLAAADVALDSLDYSGGVTSLDSLWHGLPIVTLPGALMRGRQTAAMLRLLGAGELIARDEDDYVDIATRLAEDAAWRNGLSARLLERRMALYDDTGVAQALADFLRSVEPPAEKA